MATKPLLKSNASLLQRRPLIAGTLTGNLPVGPQLKKARAAKVDLIELRLDTFKEIHKGPVSANRFSTALLLDILRVTRLPILLTLRSHTEQGRAVPAKEKWTDAARLQLLTRLLPLCDLIDVEIRRTDFARQMTRFAHAKKIGVIHSVHDFSSPGRIPLLSKCAALSQKMKGDIFKAAVTPKTNDDLERFLAWGLGLKNPGKILIGMGSTGLISRVIAHSVGSLISYGHLGTSAAPGQIPVDILSRSIRAVYGN